MTLSETCKVCHQPYCEYKVDTTVVGLIQDDNECAYRTLIVCGIVK